MTIEQHQPSETPASAQLADAKAFLQEFAQASRDAAVGELATAAKHFLDLVQIAEAAEQDPSILSEQDRGDLLLLIQRCVEVVQNTLEEAPGSVEQLRDVTREVESRWGGSLDLELDGYSTGPSEDGFDGWDQETPVDQGESYDAPSELSQISSEEIEGDDGAADVDLELILNELKQSAQKSLNQPPAESNVEHDSSPSTPPTPASTPNFAATTDSPSGDSRILDDPEMAEAYLDDAVRCVASMEQALLAYEADTSNRQALNQVCRELHTLKGASASVELNDLAAFLHQVEDSVRLGCDPGSAAPDPASILESIDKVRAQIDAISGQHASAPSAESDGAAPASAPSANFDQPTSQEPTLRVKAAQVDRLMDMLAELVMLRNRRDSRVERLKSVQNELLGCASRVRGLDAVLGQQAIQRKRPTEARIGTRSNSFSEVAADVFAAADQLRGVSEPLDAENLAISQFIRQFRQELVEIRRVPAEGLFRRLQRAIRDAAKSEGKEVQLDLVGEQTGIDRTLQESLYDPLLHVVRNAVSHGIETPEARVTAGKDRLGVVTMEARGGANFLVIEVRDNGKGLDYDALRRRGLERNLIKSDQPATEAELAQLIFHPGFSTQTQTSEISGRGVGMDVVASAIERLRGWIEIESTPGKGCCIRITVPLESTIEHAMLFRESGQIFAIPMRFVHTVNTGKDEIDSNNVFGANAVPVAQIPFSNLFGSHSDPIDDSKATLVVGFGADVDAVEAQPFRAGPVRVALQVDEIVGPEEVVMRPLPGLLRNQRLYTGVSLAGSGEVVLALDTQQLLERCDKADVAPEKSSSNSLPRKQERDGGSRPRALVVDDSATARRAMVGMLQQRGFEVSEALDGAEGFETLQAESFDLLVSDLEMPRMDGLELLQSVRNTSSLESLIAILSSSRDDEPFQTRARDLNAAAYLIKPVEEDQLDEVLRNYSFGQRAVRE